MADNCKDWIEGLPLNVEDKASVLKAFNDCGIEMEDLLEMTSKKDLEELGLNLKSRIINVIWNTIDNINSENENTNVTVSKNQVSNDDNCDDKLVSSDSNVMTITNTTNGNVIDCGGMTGLNNIGNTCFMNSAIQCLLHIPEFTDSLANYLISKKNEDGEEEEAKNVFIDEKGKEFSSKDKQDWIDGLEPNTIVDVYNASYDRWYGAKITSIEYYYDNEEQRRKVGGIDVDYRSYTDSDKLIFYESNGIDDTYRIDPANTHGNEAECQHWRHDLTINGKCDVFSSSKNEWVVGTIVEYIPKKGFKIRCHNERRCKIISRYNTEYLAELGTYTSNNESSYSWMNPVNYWEKSSKKKHNNNNNNGRGRNTRKKMSFFDVWLDMINKVHLKKNKFSIRPQEIYNKMVSYDPSLGDRGQHDAIEALTVILDGIKESLPPKLIKKQFGNNSNNIISELYELKIPHSIYDNKNKWDLTKDSQVCKQLISTNKINFGGDLVSQYFQGIECISEACLNCGSQRRLYRTFNELSLAVTNGNDVNVNLMYYSLEKSEYKAISLKVPFDCKVSMLKYLALCKNILCEPNITRKLYKFELVFLKNSNINSNDFASIMLDDEQICKKKYSNGNGIILIVPRIIIHENDISKHKMIRIRTIYGHLSKNGILLFCVLSLSREYFSHKWFKQQLQDNQTRNKFFSHFENTNNTNSSNNNNGKRRSSKTKNPQKNNLVNFKSLNFKSYCDGDIIKEENDFYWLNKSNNIIISYFSCNDASMTDYDYKYDDDDNTNADTNTNTNINMNDNNSKNEFDSLDINVLFMSDELKTCVNCVLMTIMSKKKRIDYLEKEIKNFENIINSNKNNNNNKLLKSERQFEKLKNRMNTSVNEKTIENYLTAHRVVLAHLKKLEDEKQNIVLSIQEKLPKISNLTKGNGIFNKPNMQLQNLDQCFEEYSSIKYIEKYNLAPTFECKCDRNNTIPFVQSCTNIVVYPKAFIVSLARGKNNVKMTSSIDFNENLVLSNEIKYDLRAVCNHLSQTTKFGHYNAYVKQLRSNKWFHCDDSYTRSTNTYSVRNAVMMIYARN